MFGANGSAVDGGGLLQLRALDWNVDGENACITISCSVDYTYILITS